MIFDVLAGIGVLQEHPVKGVNAQISAVAAERGVTVPPINEFLLWSQSKLPTEMLMPTIQVVAESSSDLDGVSQQLRQATHRISIVYWDDEFNTDQARKNTAITAHGILRFLENLIGTAGVQEVRNVDISFAGWAASGRLFAYTSVSFQVIERDIQP